jgi:hypothetical protein
MVATISHPFALASSNAQVAEFTDCQLCRLTSVTPRPQPGHAEAPCASRGRAGGSGERLALAGAARHGGRTGRRGPRTRGSYDPGDRWRNLAKATAAPPRCRRRHREQLAAAIGRRHASGRACGARRSRGEGRRRVRTGPGGAGRRGTHPRTANRSRAVLNACARGGTARRGRRWARRLRVLLTANGRRG